MALVEVGAVVSAEVAEAPLAVAVSAVALVVAAELPEEVALAAVVEAVSAEVAAVALPEVATEHQQLRFGETKNRFV